MIPVYLHGADGDQACYSAEEFAHNLIRICEDHHAHNRAAAFVLVIYDLTRPALGKALDDPVYWAALDEISGNALSVFSLHESLVRDVNLPREEQVRGIRQVAASSREIAEQYFGLHDIRTPSLLFFQVNEHQEVYDFVLIELLATSTHRAFEEVRSILMACAAAVRDSTGRVIRNPEDSFERLQKQLLMLKVKQKAGALLKKAVVLRDFLSLFH